MLVEAVLLCALLQQQPPPPTKTIPPPKRPSTSDEDDSPSTPSTPAKLLKYQYDETKKDIDKLVKLVGEVQDEIEKAGENVLPLNTLKKLEEVERLSRKIRGKIKQ